LPEKAGGTTALPENSERIARIFRGMNFHKIAGGYYLWKRLQDYYSKRFIHVNYECWANKQIKPLFKESGRISLTKITAGMPNLRVKETPPPVKRWWSYMKEQAVLRSSPIRLD
jgi:hypothetical protein